MAIRTFDEFTIETLEPAKLTASELADRAQAIQSVLYSAWTNKFVPGLLSREDLKTKINPANTLLRAQQVGRVTNPNRQARYSLGYNQPDSVHRRPSIFNASSMLRVETYKPRNPFKRPYPNVTDLEVADGRMRGQQENQAAALLYLALVDFTPEVKVSSYILAEDNDSYMWLTAIGFRSSGNFPTERVGGSTLRYAHVQAPSVGQLQSVLEAEYPFLAGK